MAASPILWKDTLIVCMENVGESFAAGIDRQDRREPLARRPAARHQLGDAAGHRQPGPRRGAVPDRRRSDAHDPATGKRLWRGQGQFNAIPSPTLGDGMVFAPGGKFTALRPGAARRRRRRCGRTPSWPPATARRSTTRASSTRSAPRGVVNCAEPGTGKILWSERVDGNYAASPLAADGKIYVTSEEGMTTVLQAGGEAKVLAVNTLPDTILASPVAADGGGVPALGQAPLLHRQIMRSRSGIPQNSEHASEFWRIPLRPK